MRIAQIAPLFESVPPRLYGGTERVVSYLTEELVRQGHQVTLFASGDSDTTAELVPCCERGLRLTPGVIDPLPHVMVMLEKVRRRAASFDVLHFHIDYLHFPLFRTISHRTITTLHGRLDIPDLIPLFEEFDDMPVVSISAAQRLPLPGARWVGTVQHGLPLDLYRPGRPATEPYLAFVGRISSEKRPDQAVAIARGAGMKLKIGAKVAAPDRAYYEREIRPLLDDPLVEFLGEVDETAKAELLGGATALLLPIDWPEPFGLVMLEAMACGTPVVAFRRGSIPEVVDDGVTGFAVDGIAEAVEAVNAAAGLDRAMVRRRFEHRFNVRRMANDYLSVYRATLAMSAALRRGQRLPSGLSTGGAEERLESPRA